MFKYSEACTDALIHSLDSYNQLNIKYNQLEVKANDWKNEAIECSVLLKKSQVDLEKENNRKRIWRRIAIGEGTLILGVAALFYFL